MYLKPARLFLSIKHYDSLTKRLINSYNSFYLFFNSLFIMRIAVSSIPDSGIEEELRLLLNLEEVRLKGDVQVSLKVSKFGDKVLVDARVVAMTFLVCSRCLKEFSFPIKVDFSDEYIPYREFTEKTEHELTKDELDVNFYQDDEIDIEDLIREQILLTVPMKSLCKSDCQGICPKCGKNLNETPIHRSGCSIERIDPRLTPLKNLKNLYKE